MISATAAGFHCISFFVIQLMDDITPTLNSNYFLHHDKKLITLICFAKLNIIPREEIIASQILASHSFVQKCKWALGIFFISLGHSN